MSNLRDGLGNSVHTSDIRGSRVPDKDELKKLVKAVTPEERVAVIKRHEAKEISKDFFIRFSILEFVGYNPSITIDTLIAMSRVYNDPQAVLDADIDSCLAIVLYLGNVQPKAFSRRSDEGKAMIEYLSGKYNIRTGSTESNMEPEVLTFPRVQSAFPVKAIRMARERPPKSVSGEYRSDRVPGFMRLHSFGCLCPPGMPITLQELLIDACSAYSADMSIAYTKGNLKKNKRPIVYDAVQIGLEQRDFVIIASGSPVPDPESKKHLLLELDLPSHYDSIVAACRQFRGVINKIDPSDVVVMSKIEFEKELSRYLVGDVGVSASTRTVPPTTTGTGGTDGSSAIVV